MNRLFKRTFPLLFLSYVYIFGLVLTCSIAADRTVADVPWLTQAAGTLSSTATGEAFAQLATGIASEKATEEVTSWLQTKGKVSITSSANQRGSLKGSEITNLYPIYETEQMMFFNQNSFHRSDERNQGNFGTGFRYFFKDWMAGANTFYDRDFTSKHSRVGIGAEYARDFLRISTNRYDRGLTPCP